VSCPGLRFLITYCITNRNLLASNSFKANAKASRIADAAVV